MPFLLIDESSGKTFDLTEYEELLAGRSADAQLPLMDGDCSRRQFRIARRNDGWQVESLSSRVPTWCDDKALVEPVELRDGLRLRVNKHMWRVADRTVAHLGRGEEDRATAFGGGDEWRTVWRTNVDSLPGVVPASPGRIALADDLLLGRESPADVKLSHVQVSRRHARLRRVDGQVLLTDLGSMNGTFVNGRRVTSETTLSIGDRIGIGPFLLTFTGAALVADNRSDNVRLCARGLSRSYSPGGGAPARTLLDDVSIVIPPRSFVCLLGPSGCGKTTLLAALSARSPADHGRVTVNGQDLYDDFDALKRDIVVVPQRDILHEQLPLAEALRYTARLRLPSDTTEAEHGARVAEVLDKVGLAKKAQTLIEKLSGGQRRRASLANELISNPNLLFLDEVTSGLDEQIDGEVMRFCRDLTDGGKTVVCVTHTLANVAQYCHLVVFLGCGGRLAFMGTPAEALEYFEVSRLGDIYSLLENEDDARRWQEKFRASTQYSTYVTEPLNSDGGVRAEPRRSERGRQVRRELREALRQTPILLSRYARVFAADRKALGGLILQCAVIAFVMYLVFGPALRESASTFRRSALAANAVFVLGISCFWFGCNNAAKEIVKERVIFSKELQVNLAVLAYYASKFLLQCGVAAVQALCLLLLVQWCCELPGDFGWQLAVLVVGAISGVAVGLFLSAAASSEEMALTLVPLALVPQIVLSDVFIELTGLSQRLGQMFATNYWIFGALRGTLPDELQEQLNPPLAGPIAIGWSMTATGLHVALLVIASIGVLYVRDDLLATASRPSVEALRNAAKRWRW